MGGNVVQGPRGTSAAGSRRAAAFAGCIAITVIMASCHSHDPAPVRLPQSNAEDLRLNMLTIKGVAFSHSGTTLATATEYQWGDQRCDTCLWRTADWTQIARLPGATGPVAFSQDDSKVISVTFTGMVAWDVRSGRALYQFGSPADYLAFIPGTNRLCALEPSAGLRVWHILPKRATLEVTRPDAAGALAVSPDGRAVYTLSKRDAADQLVEWDTVSWREKRRFGRADAALAIAVSHDGRLVAAQNYPHLSVFDVASGRTLVGLPVDGGVTAIAFTPDDTQLAASTNSTSGVMLFRRNTWQLAATLNDEEEGGVMATSIAMSPNGSELCAGCQDYTTRVWRIGSRSLDPSNHNPR